MKDGAKKNFQRTGMPKNYFEGKELTADSNYHSTTNIEKCEEEGLEAYIPDNKFRIRDSRFSNQNRFKPESKKFSYFEFQYDAQHDHYICPNGKKLNRFAKRLKQKGRFVRAYVSDEADGKICQLRSKCLRYENTKRRYLSIFWLIWI